MFVKICGITNEEDALLAVALGAHAVGFVFAPSPRQIAPAVASDIVKRLPLDDVITVGVFRDEVPQRVSDIVHASGLQAVQLHGHERADDARWIRNRVPMLIQGFPAGDPRVLQAAEYGADAILLDAPSPGSAQLFDWALASEVPTDQRVIVAGGLNPDNVAAAIATTGCWGVDVSSGVERQPGYKDAIKLRDFIQAALGAFETRGDAPPGGDRRRASDGFADGGELGGWDAAGVYDWQEDT